MKGTFIRENMVAENTKGVLLIMEGEDAGKVVGIEAFPFSIGRLPTNNLPLGDNQISREHAQLKKSSEGGVEIADLRSRNGLFVNDQRVERARLRPGDRIRVGATVIIFETNSTSLKGAKPLANLDPPSSNKERSLEVDEPTSIRNLADLESALPTPSNQSLEEVIKLFRSTLPPRGVIPQILDVFFQSFAPDRAEIIWETEEKVEVARSRHHGKQCPTFSIPPEVTTRGLGGAATMKAPAPDLGESTPENRSILVAPLRAYGEVKGWVYGDRSSEMRSFGSKEVERLDPFAAIAGAVLERSTILLDQKRLQERILLMEKHLSPELSRMLASQVMNIEESMLSVEEREVSVLFSDIEGFTSLSERLSAPEVAALLNEYFQRMVDVVNVNNGMVNKFIGDAVMALFGAPKSHDNDAVNAVTAALQMVEALKLFWDQIDERKRFNIRIGINTGKVVAGNIGSEKKMEYTVLGDEVNLASRFESISPSNVVTIGPRTAELVKDHFSLEKVSDVKVKGKSKALEVFRVLGVLEKSS